MTINRLIQSKIKIFGNRKDLPNKILEIFQNIEESSCNNTNLILNIAFNYGFKNEEFLNLFNDYDFYYNKMKNNLEILSKKFKKDGIDYILIDQLDNPETSFLKTDYHLNENGHDEVFKKF